MNRKIAAIWLNVIIVLSFIVIIVEIAPVVRAQTTWYVDDVPGNGGPGDPPEDFTSIQDAINAANPGDTVFVYNGTYYEHLTIQKSINLVGEDRENTIIDGSGSGDVIFVLWVDRVSITGFTAINGDNGIYLWISDNSTIIDCNSKLNNHTGISIRDSKYTKVVNCSTSQNYFEGIFIWLSENTTLSNCNSSHNIHEGIQVWDSDNTTIVNSTFNSNGGISVFGVGMHIRFSNNSTILNCECSWNGNDGFYIDNSNDNTVIDSISNWNGRRSYFGDGFVISNSFNNMISNCTSNYNNYTGIYVSLRANTIINCTCSFNNFGGIRIYYSDNNTIKGNTIISNVYFGISLYNSSKDNIVNNSFINGGLIIGGDELFHFNTHTIPTNNIVNEKPLYYFKNNSSFNISGIPVGQLILANCTDVELSNLEIDNTDVGIEIAYSTHIEVKHNEISSNNYYGIMLNSSSNNTIKNNNISSNLQGIHLFSSRSNSIYHNNISNNLFQAFDDTNNTNDWDNGYPSGGNFWSDYTGVDNFKGPEQNIPGKDGIGDTPYDIDSNSWDKYPLLVPWTYYMILKQGWNLISIPLIQEERNLTRVLGSIDGWYDAVQWYELTGFNNPWAHHKVDKPRGNDLFEITEIMGFWIHITQPGDTIFLYNGTQPTSNQTIPLHPGWNMVGYPSFTSYNRTEGLNNLTFDDQVDAIWSYDAATQKGEEMGESDYFIIGRGYYIHAKSECEWEVPL